MAKTKNKKDVFSSKTGLDELTDIYVNPLTTRYSSKAMSRLFSERHRIETFRSLWIILAEEEKRLGIPIRSEQISALKQSKESIDFEKVRELEEKLRHDVMSHIKAFALVAPEAEGIIHLGATSCYVTDNADILIQREALVLIRSKLVMLLRQLKNWMLEWKDEVTTGFTHFQAAQPVTVGKRIALWTQDLLWDAEELDFVLERLRPLGCKGATGTQASFLTLFKGDKEKVQRLDQAVCRRLGFEEPVPLSAQTLSRKMDCWMVNSLSNLAASFSKMSHDLRLLQHLGEMREPFGQNQVGSSAMAYKRNPVLAERMTSLTRLAMNLAHNAAWTHSSQWLERSLDDSANRRISLPEIFLCLDAICEIAMRITKEIEVDRDRIRSRLNENAALFGTETSMMVGVLAGGSRQELHEKIRRKVARKNQRKDSPQASQDEALQAGMSKEQVLSFVKQQLDPFLKKSQKSTPKVEFDSAQI